MCNTYTSILNFIYHQYITQKFLSYTQNTDIGIFCMFSAICNSKGNTLCQNEKLKDRDLKQY